MAKSKVERVVLLERVDVETATYPNRGAHTIQAPPGFRVVSGGFIANEEGNSGSVSWEASFPGQPEESSDYQSDAWHFWYVTHANNVALQFRVICERSDTTDVQVYLSPL